MWCITYFVLFGFAAQVTSIRVSDSSFVDSWTGDEAACGEELKKVHKGLTLNRLFKPLLEGRYRIRNRYSSKYLTASEDGNMSTSRAYVDSSGWSLWNLRRVQGVKGIPTYTLVNRHSGRFLARGGASSVIVAGERQDAAVWYLEPGPNGIYNYISMDEETNQRMVEDNMTNVVNMGAPVEDFYESWKSYWEFELVGKPRGRVWPRRARGEYRFQWQQAANIPMFQYKGGTFTWADMCEEAGQAEVCPNGYADIRQYYLAIGRISETGGNNIPTEAAIRTCDGSIGFGKQMYELSELVKEVKTLAGDSCKDFDIRTVSRLMRQGIEETCYTDCMRDINTKIQDFDCKASNEENWNNFGADVFENMECDVSPSTLLYLVDFALQQKCWTWKSKSPLWVPQDNGPGKTNLAKADGVAVCKVKDGQESWRSSRAIDQPDYSQNASVPPAGQHCIEGTACSCPSTWRKKFDTLSEKRQARSLSAQGVSHKSVFQGVTPNFFIADSDIGLRNVLNTMSRSMAIGTLVQMTVFAQTLQAALLATPFGAPFLIQTGIALFGYMRHAVTWTCSESVGCWPQEPKRVRTQEQSKACRLPDETEKGGSKVWFMPPPGFTLFHRGGFWSIRKCALKYCSKKDMVEQRVGFFEDKRNVYNCQPLPYDEMDAEQQGKYTETLRATIPTEYEKFL